MRKFFIHILLFGLMLSCSSDEVSQIFQGSAGLGEPKILVASSGGADFAVAMYDINGNFITTIKNYNISQERPRGIAALSGREILVAVDRTDHIEKIDFVSGRTEVISDLFLNGNVLQLERHPTHGIFVVDSNAIESFSDEGVRLGNPRVNVTEGACTLSTPRGIDFDSQGRLLVTNTGNDDLSIYDISDPLNPVCVVSNTTLGNVNPVAILAHSNGVIYVATQGDDSIYTFDSELTGAGTVLFNDTSIINNPVALLELPNGNILVSSDATNTIVEMAPDGTIINPRFIQDSFTNSAEDISLIQQGRQ